jgi:hypothetical protein
MRRRAHPGLRLWESSQADRGKRKWQWFPPLQGRKLMPPRNKTELMPGAAVKRIRAIGVTRRICKSCTQGHIIRRVYEARSPCAYRIVAIGVTVVGSPPTVPPMGRSLRGGPKNDPRGESKGRNANPASVSATIASLARSSDVHRPSAQSDVEHVAPEQINRSDRQQQERDLPPLRCAQKLRLAKYHNKCNSEWHHGGHPIQHTNETVSRPDREGNREKLERKLYEGDPRQIEA